MEKYDFIDEKINQMLIGFGALAETCRALYSSLLTSGFNPQEALWLSGEYLKQMVSESSHAKKEEE